jgi:hypothetical protein
MKQWWGEYAESHGEFDVALGYYRQADDQLSIIRALCNSGRIDEALFRHFI